MGAAEPEGEDFAEEKEGGWRILVMAQFHLSPLPVALGLSGDEAAHCHLGRGVCDLLYNSLCLLFSPPLLDDMRSSSSADTEEMHCSSMVGVREKQDTARSPRTAGDVGSFQELLSCLLFIR